MPNLHLYLSDEEYALLNRAAERLGTTKAYVLRLCFRKPLGLPIGGEGTNDYVYLSELREVHVPEFDP